jgi:hypothetical protein
MLQGGAMLATLACLIEEIDTKRTLVHASG